MNNRDFASMNRRPVRLADEKQGLMDISWATGGSKHSHPIDTRCECSLKPALGAPRVNFDLCFIVLYAGLLQVFCHVGGSIFPLGGLCLHRGGAVD